ncbi:hypothetical protein HBH98_055750 [Parastagonospora nodorum]|nr:hypothetical protein HBH53_133570 [Parastagonospora nodorum]KAH4202305.1 hypothetical protein HBH42_016600 [Parastagonospora nodorum]KAH4207774.1 hypothetical protein HBI95_108410 [Parastagonospora nodorum]KAH4268553.1 hypothetical protein HBI03_061310 [Parastagonospora nodorum]KAH4279308.1 hypothetical protein HBI04_076760 [Parastagonospora nodorum]
MWASDTNSAWILVPFVRSVVCTIATHVNAAVRLHRLAVCLLHNSLLPTQLAQLFTTEERANLTEQAKQLRRMKGLGKSVLVIGASRGIGLQFVRTLVEQKYTVWGTVRPQSNRVPAAEMLHSLGAKVLVLDFLDEQSIIAASKAIEVSGKLDVLINCGGTAPRSWEEETQATILTKFKIMALGPFLATKHFAPLLSAGSPGKIINISSDLASIKNTDGGRMSYRMAKASLNMQTASLAADFKASNTNIAIVAVHPGRVPTDLSGGKGDVDLVESVQGMVKIMEGMDMESSGRFLYYNGEEMSW